MSNTGKLFVFTGARGVGKTTLAATYLPPSQVDQVFYHDSEHSANQIVEQLQEANLAFGYYGSLPDRFTGLPAENDLLHRISGGELPWVDSAQKRSLATYYQAILADLDEHLEPGKYRVYVHDTLEKLEAGMAAWVDLNKKKAGVSKTAYGGMWNEGVFPLYEQLIASIYDRGVEVIILTSHLKTPWEDSRPVVSKVSPAGKKLLYKLSALMLWLVNDNHNKDGAPAGLVLKERLGKLLPTKDDTWHQRRMLPNRIPCCTWNEINRYLEEGCDLKLPDFGEMLSSEEVTMISELLTDEQMKLMILGAESDLEALRKETAPIVHTESILTPESEAKRLAVVGQTAEEIAKLLDKPLPLVKKWLKEES